MDDAKLFSLIEDAILQGSIDEEMILLYARVRNLPPDEYEELEMFLGSCKCNRKKATKACPEAGTLQLNFDTVLHKCLGRNKKCANLVSAGVFDKLFTRWQNVVRDQFGGWEDKDVTVEGDVYNHDQKADKYNLLLKKVTLRIGDKERDVPKIWATVDASEYLPAKSSKLDVGDKVSLVGYIEWDEKLHFYHLTDVTDLKVKK
jgi:hypothetical protein